MDKNIKINVKSNYIINIILIIALLIIGYLYYSDNISYKNNINKIKNKYELIEDSLNNRIKSLDLKYTNLELKNKKLSENIDSLKNNQHDNEKPSLSHFYGLSPDSISNIFAGYDPNAYRFNK